MGLALLAPDIAAGECTSTSPGNPCIPGGGTPATDCFLEWRIDPVPALDRTGAPRARAVCYEGDLRCDLDPDLENRSCDAAVSLCINNGDPRLSTCAASAIQGLQVVKPDPTRPRNAAEAASVEALESVGAVDFGVPVLRRGLVVVPGSGNATGNLCSAPAALVVPLRTSRSGRVSRQRRTFKVQVVTSEGLVDRDSLGIECRPSTCGNSLTETDHEQCDDGNRTNGDGCDQGCQVEVPPTPTPTPAATGTPTPSPAPTATPTPTPTPTSTAAPTPTPEPTPTPTPTPTPEPTPTPTPEPTPTPTPTPVPPAFAVNLIAYRPQTEAYGAPFQRRAVPEAEESSPGAGSRLNGDDDNGNGLADATDASVPGENDLVELTLEASPAPAPPGWEYALVRSSASVKVWHNASKDFAVLGANDEQVVAFGGGAVTLWVEQVAAGSATLELRARPAGGGSTAAADAVAFHPFTSVVIALGGENQGPSDPPDSNHGVFNIAANLYAMGYDVHMYDEDDVGSSGAGEAYDEVVSAVSERGIGIVSIFGYSHGGGSTHDLAERLANDAASIGTFTVPYTAYIDGIENDSDIDLDSERRLPPGTQVHVNYYQRSDFLIRGNSVSGANVDVNVNSTPWGGGLQHTGIDDHANVRSGVQDPLVARVAR